MTDKRQWTETIKIMRESGIPFYSFAETAAKALSSMIEYSHLKSRSPGEPEIFTDINKEKALSTITSAKEAKRQFLTQGEANEIMLAYKIPAAKGILAQTARDVTDATRNLKYPVVLKIESEGVIHKTDAGGVALNIQSHDQLRAEVSKMEKRFADKKVKFYLQEQLPAGKEVIVGASRVPNLGHLIMFGLGGIYVEVLKDVKFAVAPISVEEARLMIESVKGFPILRGFRAEKGVSIDSLIEILQRVSQLVTDIPEISELDLNPVFAYPENAKVVDVRIGISL
jgi:acetyltransferase